MAAGQVPALFGWRCVAHIGKQIGLHACVVEQCVALGCRPVSGHTLARALLLQQPKQQIVLHLVSSGLEPCIGGQLHETGVFLLSQQLAHTAGGAELCSGKAAVDPQAASMGGQLFHVPHAQASGSEYAAHRAE